MSMLVRCARFVLAACWAVFTAWLFVYAMPLSGLCGAAGVWTLWPSSGKPSWRRRGAVAAIGAIGLVAVPIVGLPEYATATNVLHCRTLGFTAAKAPADCDTGQLAEGQRVAREGGPLLSARERLGVHGFNHLLGLGGLVVGLPEVAAETVAMSWARNPLPEGASTEMRRRQCRATHEGVTGALADPVVWENDVPMRSTRVRKAIAKGVAQLPDRPGARNELGEVHFVQGSANIEAYGGALLYDSVRVALALEVGDSRLSVARAADGRVDAEWNGIIHYPGTDIAFAVPLPTVFGMQVLRVSETIFCGMQVDGAMNPYALTYRWTLAEDDPRLGALVGVPERGWIEARVSELASRL